MQKFIIMENYLPILLMMVLLTPGLGAQDKDDIAIEQTVRAVYAAIGFGENTIPDTATIRELFLLTATFQRFRQEGLYRVGLEEFIESFNQFATQPENTGFHELELGGKTEKFGRIAHRISAYASYFNGSETAAVRGVNSFQLIKIEGKWRVASMIWEEEQKGLPIPEKWQ